MDMKIREIDLKRIHPNLRLVFDSEAVELLAQSIRVHGQTDPIQLWFTGTSFRILDGEKRWRACKRLGLRSIKARIVPG